MHLMRLIKPGKRSAERPIMEYAARLCFAKSVINTRTQKSSEIADFRGFLAISLFTATQKLPGRFELLYCCYRFVILTL